MYIVDGHNLIPKIPGLRLNMQDDETQLLAILQDFCGRKQAGLEVFFDGAPAGYSGKRKFGRVIAHFVPASITADQAIILRVTKAGNIVRNWTVVSSDRRVQVEVKSRGCRVLSSEAFSQELGETYRSEGGLAGEDGGSKADEVEEWLRLFSQPRD